MNVIDEGLAAEKEYASTSNHYWVDLAEALDRLERNDDFKKVISEGYFKEKAVMGVSLLATDYVKKSGLRPDVMEGLIAISALQDHFLTIKRMGTAIEQDESEAEEA